MDYLAVDIGNSFFGGPSFLRDLPGVGTLVSILVSNIIVIAGIVFIFLIIYAGLEMITGAGDAQKNAHARDVLTAAVIGFIIVVLAWFIVRVIETSLGVNIFKT